MPLLSKQAAGTTGTVICNGVYQCVITRWAILVGGLLFTVLLVLHIASLRHKELTTDEPVHYKYGYRVLHGSPRRTGEIDSSTMPFSGLHAMTSDNIAIVANALGFSVDKSWAGQIKRGRYATIVLSLFLALYVARWSYELYGGKGALLSLSLYVFDPNFLAHGQLVTADLAAALMTTLALYYLWQFLKLGGKKRAFLSATTLGLSQLAKYSCVYLYPIFLVVAAIYCSSRKTVEAAVSGPRDTLLNSLRR
jgi:dolichyl-phosphate-mannose-protein mannosyltransferase